MIMNIPDEDFYPFSTFSDSAHEVSKGGLCSVDVHSIVKKVKDMSRVHKDEELCERLLEMVELNNRLEAQIQFLLIKICSSFEYDDLNLLECMKNLEHPPLAAEQSEPSVDNMEELRRQIRVLHTSFKASRVELACAIQESVKSEAHIKQQNSHISYLEEKLDSYLSQESRVARTLPKSSDSSQSRILDLEIQLKELMSTLKTSETANAGRNRLYSQHLIDVTTRAEAFVQHMQEKLEFEREDIRSRFVELSGKEQETKQLYELATQTELRRLRHELHTARQSSAEYKSRIVYLERQLLRSAEQIAAMSISTTSSVSSTTGTAGTSTHPSTSTNYWEDTHYV